MTEALREYAVAVTVFCIAAGICEIMIPESDGSIGKYVRYVISVCVAAVILIPVGKAFSGTVSQLTSARAPAISEYGENYSSDALIDRLRVEIEKKAEVKTEKNFSLKQGEVKVSVYIGSGDGTVGIISASAYLSGDAVKSSAEIAEFLKEQIGCEVYVFTV